jgi:hypothetical protein
VEHSPFLVQSPRDTIERGTQLWLWPIVDNFPAGATPVLNAQWTSYNPAGGSTTIAPNGGLVMTTPSSGGGSEASLQAFSSSVPASTTVCTCETTVQYAQLAANPAVLS